MTTKETLYRIVDALRDDEAERLLDIVQDPVSRALALAPRGIGQAGQVSSPRLRRPDQASDFTMEVAEGDSGARA